MKTDTCKDIIELSYRMPDSTKPEYSVLGDRKTLLTVVGYPKMGRRGVIEAVIHALKTNPNAK